MFYVYRGMPTRHVRIHRADCEYTAFVQDKTVFPVSSYDGIWYGPFDTMDEAHQQAEEISYRDTRPCRVCFSRTANTP